MLFDDGVPPEFVRALQSLATANEQIGVPYPFDEAADLALLKRIKTKYPLLDVADMVDEFLVWCSDARPWQNESGKPAVIRWRSRLWTRAANETRYRNRPKRYVTKTHFVATEHNEETTVMREW